MGNYANIADKKKTNALSHSASERNPGNAASYFVDSRPRSAIQRKKEKIEINDEERLEKEADHMGRMAMQRKGREPINTQTITPSNVPIQRFLYVGEGSADRISGADLIVEEDDERTPKVVALEKLWRELGEIDKKYRDLFKNQILKERAFPLRLNNWNELTAAGIVDYYDNDYLKKNEGEIAKNFKPGDKLYGIHDVTAGVDKTARPNVGRAPQMRELEGILQKAGPYKHVIIDTINNVLGISAGVAVPGPITDAEAADYLAFIGTHKRYAPLLVDKNADIRKSCKAALEYITTVKGSKIHFELSGIDLAQIATKTDGSVTGSELRSIFRRVVRGGWKPGSPGINPDNVKFYKFGKEVPPPWVSDPRLWEGYARKVLAKNTPVEKKKAGVAVGSGDDHPQLLTSGRKYNDSLKDLLSAVKEIAEDRGAEDNALDIKSVIAAGIPFRSKSDLMNAILGALDEGRQKVAQAIVDYIFENSE